MTHLDQDTSQNVWLLDASGSKPPTAIVRGGVRDNGGPVSPDGRWIAYTSEDTGRFEVYIQSFPAPGRKVQVSADGAVRSWWMRDGRQLVLLGGDFRTLSRVDIAPGATLGVGTPRRVARLPADVVWVEPMPDSSFGRGPTLTRAASCFASSPLASAIHMRGCTPPAVSSL